MIKLHGGFVNGMLRISRRPRNYISLFLGISLTLLTIQILVILSATRVRITATIADVRISKPYIILFWTKFYGERFTKALGLYQEALRDISKCPVQNCQLTDNRTLLKTSDAVIFHLRDLKFFRDIPHSRSHDQLYIFYTLEAPPHDAVSLDRLQGYFNMTFTYRLDSDIITDSYFQYFHPEVWKQGNEFDLLWEKKSKFGVTFISNCNTVSEREVYLHELSLFFPVDIYGMCGAFKCPRNKPKECDRIVSQYKFYFAFENSHCKDYVTEKISRALNQGTIPVVYGGANYTRIFPPKSFINVLDFEDPRQLAQQLHFLAQSKQAYEEYFRWRRSPETAQLPSFLKPQELSWCKLCRILNEDDKRIRVVPDIDEWWRNAAICSRPLIDRAQTSHQWLKNPKRILS